MTNDLVTYNGYRFNEYSNITVNATMQSDESNRTILYNRYRIRVETTIYADDGDVEGKAGQHFERIRDRLSKQGQQLQIHHEGFGLDFEVNATTLVGKRDVAFGPKPILLNWDPVGHINAVEVVWECEVCISACNRWTGIMSFNYGATYRIDKAGYTTRTISGHLEIALTRVGRSVPDNIEDYRERVVLGPIPNFERETTWTISSDKKRADFTIVDSQIKSPNAFPVGVISIRGNHNLNWSRHHGQGAKLPQAIRVSIELAQGQPRSRAIEIFISILQSRWRSAATKKFIESFSVEEDMFGNTFNMSCGFFNYLTPNKELIGLFPAMFEAGLGQDLSLNTWQQWKTSVAGLQSHRGQAKLKPNHMEEQIIDMCSDVIMPSSTGFAAPPFTPTNRPPRIGNEKPSPEKSYIRFDTWVEMSEEIGTTSQVTVGLDDLDISSNEFNPSKTEATLGNLETASKIERFVESQPGNIEITVKGYAERVGYEIPKIDTLKIGTTVLTRKGPSRFVQRCLGNALGQFVFGAAWNLKYVVSKRPTKLITKDLNYWADQ